MTRRGDTAAALEGRAARAVREALDCFAAAPVRDEIVRRALAAAGVSEVPEAGPELAELVQGPLREAVVSLFDEATADALVAALDPVVGMAESEPPELLDGGGEGEDPRRRVVLCIDVSPEDADLAARHAGPGTHVHAVADHLLLGDAVALSGASEVCVLVDTRHLPPRAGRMGALARRLPSGSRVVLWGGSRKDAQLLAVGHRELEWVPVGAGATVSDVVSLCTVPSVSGTRRRPVLVDRPVLIVEHEGGRRRALADHVTGLGYAVLTANSGAEALAMCARSTPLLLLVDQMLPGMGGTEVARLLRQARGDDAPPVVLMVRDVLETAEAAAVAAVIPEGVTEEKLGPLLRKLADA